jgi:hypothetical protein
MKLKTVDSVSSNEGHVRLKIYDGDLGIDEAGAELIRIYKAQADHERRRAQTFLAENVRLKAGLR